MATAPGGLVGSLAREPVGEDRAPDRRAGVGIRLSRCRAASHLAQRACLGERRRSLRRRRLWRVLLLLRGLLCRLEDFLQVDEVPVGEVDLHRNTAQLEGQAGAEAAFASCPPRGDLVENVRCVWQQYNGVL
jgi:hypothetical protein